MTAAYNPFLTLDMPCLKRLLSAGKYYIVLQRFQWPGLSEYSAFIATPYADQNAAKKHAGKLAAQQGRMLDGRTEYDKFKKLFNDPRYTIFVGKFKEADWQAKVIKHYQKNIHRISTLF
jgi:hypothetical protein